MRIKIPRILRFALIGWLAACSGQLLGAESAEEIGWRRHIIDGRSRGADGTRLADANGDGLIDIVTGWEQGGITRVYLNPGPDKAASAWPAVTVGPAQDVEDAVFVDLDHDGSMDVVSSCEGQRQALLVHWGPEPDQYMDPNAWQTEEIPGSVKRCRWMFAAPMDVDQDGRVDLVAGGKGSGSQLGWWKVPVDARDLDAWKWHPLLPVGWLMSLETVDMNGDGMLDLLFTDRKGDASGCYWLEYPGPDIKRLTKPWTKHVVGVTAREAMFLHRADLDEDGLEDVVVAVQPASIVICRRLDGEGQRWSEREIAIPDSYGGAKAPAVADFDGDGQHEIAFSTEGARDGKMGVGRLVHDGDPITGSWSAKTISGVDGVKHDLVETMDLDGDGDLDVLTCEEVTNLGVIWYENPTSSP